MRVLTALERPQLRPYLEPVHENKDPRHVYLVDRLGLAAGPERLTIEQYHWLRLFDGQRSLGDIQAELMRHSSGPFIGLETIAALARKLEEGLFLDGPAYRQVVEAAVRPPRHIGCYHGEPRALRRQLDRLFSGPRGPGLPGNAGSGGRLRAALIPHIDYPRGGYTYAWGFKEVVEQTDAALFVIIGTSHHSTHRFTLTRKHFETPLGITRTDQDYIDRLVQYYGDGLFDDELLAHLPEHSIELEVVLLQYLYETRRPFRIVPLVVGPFQDCVESGTPPKQSDDIAAMIEALRAVEAELDEPVCYIISGDLAHIGPKFGDRDPVSGRELEHSRRQDQAILQQTELADPAGFFQVIAAEKDARRICGLPPAYTLLEAIRPASGKLLHYDQYVHPRGHESVSFASVAFYRS
jgi:AmmeMemoRadiSam system protein B